MLYTNSYTTLKDILKSEYTFILSLLFGNFEEIIHLLKEKKPFYGEVLEYLYLSAPLYYSKTFDDICNRYRYVDNLLRVLFKDCSKKFSYKIRNDVSNICEDFHIEVHEFDYYYVVALMIITLERTISEDAYNLYAQFDNDIKNDIDKFLSLFLNTLNAEEFQALFYNHLEDVYLNNSTVDQSFSVLNINNYSYFLDNIENTNFFNLIEKDEKNGLAPIVISRGIVYNIIGDGTPNQLSIDLSSNQFFNNENSNFIIVGLYDANNNSILVKHYVTHLFDIEVNNIEDVIFNITNNLIINDINLNDELKKQILSNSKSFYMYTSNDIISYYIKRFTVFTTDVIGLINM